MQERTSSAAVTVHPSATFIVRFGPFIFDRDNHILSTDGAEIALPPRALSILDLLVERAGSVVSKDTLMSSVWKDACVSDASLTEAMSLLRQALDDDAQNPTYIQTVHRRGYRFVAPVVVAGHADSSTQESGEDILEQPGPSHRSRPVALWVVSAAVVIAVVAVFLGFLRRAPEIVPPDSSALRLDVSSPSGVTLPFFSTSSLALSPDGDVLVFAGRDSDGGTRLYRRHISNFECEAIAGTESSGAPFFSPDGKWIGFFAGGELRKTPLNGGVTTRICNASYAFGGSWAEDGTITFSGSYPGGLSKVSADGGEVTPLTTCNTAGGELGHWWPQVLPGGRGVLFTIWSSTLDTARIAVLDVATGEIRELMEGASFPRFVPQGKILYVTSGGMSSVPFDIEDLVTAGSSRGMVDQPRLNRFVGVAHFAVADTGTLAYLPATDGSNECDLVRIDDSGSEHPLSLEPRIYRNLRVSQQGSTVAVTILDGSRSDVWTTRLAAPSLNRLTFSGFNIEPRWSPNGEWIFFASNRDGAFNIHRKPASGNGNAERLSESELHQYPQTFTPDGKRLLFSEANLETGLDIWIMELDDPDRSTTPLVRTPADEQLPSLSPDGRWVAYLSNETSRWEVYIRSLATEGGVRQVSNGGAGEPFWSRDGTLLHFTQRKNLISIPVASDPELSLGQASSTHLGTGVGAIDSQPSGRGFIAIKARSEQPRIDAVRVVVNPS